MFYYARSDTHYLLYIYDMMRNELLEQSAEEPTHNLVRRVLDKSKDTSLRRYETFAYDAEGGLGPFGWFNMLIKQSAGKLSKTQFAVFRALHEWRDEAARREDESTLYVMGNSTLFGITRRMPPDPKALHSLLDNASHIAKRDAFNLFNIVSKAQAEGANGPSVVEIIRRHNPSTMGIGEVAKSVFPQLTHNETRNDAGVLEVTDLVSHNSKLWGKIPISSRWEGPSKVKAGRTMQFELPWAQYLKSSKLSEAETQLQRPVAQEEESAIPLTDADAPPASDEDFTLKAGLRRKVSDVESESESGEVDDAPSKPEPRSSASAEAEEIAVLDDAEMKKARRKAKKAERKARKQALEEQVQGAKGLAKRAKKEGFSEAAESLMENGDEDQKPFDYSKAKSVLKAARTTKATSQGGRFNPYGMAAEGPKAARKMHGEKPGKSATFRK